MAIDLLSSTTETSSDTGSDVAVRSIYRKGWPLRAIQLSLDVTADESTNLDYLDAIVQAKIDGTNYVDICRFTRHVGDAGAKRYHAKILPELEQPMFEEGETLQQGEVRHFIGETWRVKWTVNDDSESASFTFSVSMQPLY